MFFSDAFHISLAVKPAAKIFLKFFDFFRGLIKYYELKFSTSPPLSFNPAAFVDVVLGNFNPTYMLI